METVVVVGRGEGGRGRRREGGREGCRWPVGGLSVACLKLVGGLCELSVCVVCVLFCVSGLSVCVCCLVAWLFGCLVAWLFGCLVVWLFGCYEHKRHVTSMTGSRKNDICNRTHIISNRIVLHHGLN